MAANNDPYAIFDEISGGDKASTKAAAPASINTAVTTNTRGEGPAPSVIDVIPLSERFSRNTSLALDVQTEIMKLPLDPDDPMYGAHLRAKAAVSSNQISSQIKTDEAAMKAQRKESCLHEIKAAMEEYRRKYPERGGEGAKASRSAPWYKSGGEG